MVKEIDGLIKGIFHTVVVIDPCVVLFFAVVYFVDMELVFSTINSDFHDRFNLKLPTGGVTLLTILFMVYLAFKVYLIVYKWLQYVVMSLPVLHVVGIWITGKGLQGKAISLERRIQMYRSIYLFMILRNEVSCYLLLSITVMATLLTAISLAIFLTSKVSLLSIYFLGLVIMIMGFTNMCYFSAKKIQECSKAFIEELTIGGTPKTGHFLLLKKVRVSLRECRMYCGTFYYVDRRVLPQINDAIINNTISILFMLKS